MVRKVGIFAGSFDPIHDGHIAFARQALETSGLEKVFFLVEPRPRRKQGVRAFDHRLQMVRLAIADEPRFGDIELEQARFSVSETLPILKERFKGAELHLLFGDDVLKHLADWPHVEQLVHDVHFIIGVRKTTVSAVKHRLHALEQAKSLKLKFDLFASASPDLTSSQIRVNLKRTQQSQGLPEKVKVYIQANGLYYESGTKS